MTNPVKKIDPEDLHALRIKDSTGEDVLITGVNVCLEIDEERLAKLLALGVFTGNLDTDMSDKVNQAIDLAFERSLKEYSEDFPSGSDVSQIQMRSTYGSLDFFNQIASHVIQGDVLSLNRVPALIVAKVAFDNISYRASKIVYVVDQGERENGQKPS